MLTKLEAVNICLEAIGEDPVSSLASGLPDAEKAERFLDRISAEVQETGWQVNTETNFRVTPQTDNKIKLPPNTIRADSAGVSRHLDVVVRRVDGERVLYNTTDQTYEFTGPVYLDMVLEFDFEDLTSALQRYIAYLAAERFQQSELGSEVIDVFVKEQRLAAENKLHDAEGEDADHNVLRDNRYCLLATYRRNQLYGS